MTNSINSQTAKDIFLIKINTESHQKGMIQDADTNKKEDSVIKVAYLISGQIKKIKAKKLNLPRRKL